MSKKIFQAKFNAKCGGSPINIEVEANDSYQAKKIIEMRPDFKSFYQQPYKV